MDRMSTERTAARWWTVAAQCVGLCDPAAALVLTAGEDRWQLWPLLVIAVFTVVSDLTAVFQPSMRVYISGSFLGVLLAAVVFGGGPGGIVGVLSVTCSWPRT